jgi:cytosine/adenosine deaminase-related metal-dependent hydrolase
VSDHPSGNTHPTGITLRARYLLPVGGGPIEHGWIRLSGRRIAALGRGAASGPVHDLGDAIIVPGLVNAHTHLEFSDMGRPLDGDGGLPGWIGRVVQLRRDRSDDASAQERIRSSIASGLEESAAAGVTAVGEIATAVLPEAYRAAGPQVRVYREALGLSAAAADPAATTAIRDIERLAACGQPAGISPHAPYSVTAAIGQRVLQAARRRGLPAAMHLGESEAEEELVAHGTGAFRRLLEDLGAWPSASPPALLPAADWISRLARGPRGIVVHGTFLAARQGDEALSRLSRHRDRLCVTICPRTTRLLSGGLPPLATFRAAGLRVAVGTDSRASNPDLSILAECRTLVDAGLCSPAESLRMATLDGAWALLFEHRAGILAPGRPADLAILRPANSYSDPHEAALDPATKVIATLRSGKVISGSLEL